MKRFISTLALIMVLCVPAFALSDAEYLKWRKTSAEFREADDSMSDSYNSCKKVLPSSDFDGICDEQREWIKSGRDERAEEIMKEEDCSRLEAYIKATEERDHELYHNIQMYEMWYVEKYGDLPPAMKE